MAKEVPSPHEVRLNPLDTNPVFLCLGYFCVSMSIFLCPKMVRKGPKCGLKVGVF